MESEKWNKLEEEFVKLITIYTQKAIGDNSIPYEDRELLLNAAEFADKYIILQGKKVQIESSEDSDGDIDKNKIKEFENQFVPKSQKILEVFENIIQDRKKGIGDLKKATEELKKDFTEGKWFLYNLLTARIRNDVNTKLQASKTSFDDLKKKLANQSKAARKIQDIYIKYSKNKNVGIKEAQQDQNNNAMVLYVPIHEIARNLLDKSAEACKTEQENKVTHLPKFEKTAEKEVRKIVDMLKDGFKEERERLQKALDDLKKRGADCIKKFSNAIKEWLEAFKKKVVLLAKRKNQGQGMSR